MHSTFSDGEFSPTRLVDIAKGNGVSVLCLTDHDTFEGIPEFMAAAKAEEISAFPGIEITVRYRGFNLHLLAYFESIESLSDELSHEVMGMASKRERRMRELVCKHFLFPSFLAPRCILQGIDQKHFECWEQSQDEPSL